MTTGQNYDHIFKLLLVGDSAVGKSSILVRFTDDEFSQDIPSTIGVDFKVKHINVNKKRIKLTIWDTAGQERFRTLTSSYYRGAQGAILVYDITRKETLENLRTWLKELDTYATFPDIVKLLVGNKIDLEDKRQVSRQDAEQFAKEHGMLFVECSAKTNQRIDQVFEEVAQQILERSSLLEGSEPTRLLDERDEQQEGGICSYCIG